MREWFKVRGIKTANSRAQKWATSIVAPDFCLFSSLSMFLFLGFASFPPHLRASKFKILLFGNFHSLAGWWEGTIIEPLTLRHFVKPDSVRGDRLICIKSVCFGLLILISQTGFARFGAFTTLSHHDDHHRRRRS